MSEPAPGHAGRPGNEEPPQVALRPATADDAERLFGWANDPETRAASFSSDPIPWDAHVSWLEASLADPARRLWIALLDGEPVGQVRLDLAGTAEVISVSVAPHARGRGLGVALIRAACTEAAGPVVAEIRADNERSIRAFAAVGFVTVEQGADRVVMRRAG